MSNKLPTITRLMQVVLFFVATYSFLVGSAISWQIYAAPGINRTMSFQGKIVNSDGTNVVNGNYNMEFALYSVATSGTPLWTETRTGGNQVTVTDGIFRVALGEVTTIPTSIDFNSDSLYLSINFDGDGEMDPRVRLAAVPYAFNAEKVAGLTVTNTTGTLTIPDATTINFSGANNLTFTTSAITNVTLPITGTLATLAGVESFTNKTIGATGLVFSGATTDITTGANEHFSIMPNGSGNVGIGTTSPISPFNVAKSISSGSMVTIEGSLTSGVENMQGLTIASSIAPSAPANNRLYAGLGVHPILSGSNFTSTSYVRGVDSATYWSGSGTLAEFAGLVSGFEIWGTGTVENRYGLHVLSPYTGSGIFTNNYGIRIEPQSGTGGSSYGIAIGSTATQNLWLNFNSNSTTANGGIAFGSSRDTNLYRSAANTLRTNDSFIADGNVGINTTTMNERLHVNGNIRADGSVLGNSFDRPTAGALTIGNATATSVSICNSASCDTIEIGNNADADTIIIGDSLDGLTIASTAFNVNSSGAISGITTFSSAGDWTWSATTPQITINAGEILTITDGTDSFVIDTAGSSFSFSDGSNAFTFDADTGPLYTGTARPAKKITISPEYAGGTLTTFYGAGTESAITGFMTADVETTASNDLRTYYEWFSSEATLHGYVVAVRITLPQDFSAWATSNAVQINYTTQSTSSANNSVSAYVYLSSNSTTAVASSVDNVSLSANAWQLITIDDSVLDSGSAPEWDGAGETAIVYIRMRSMDNNMVKIGDIVLNYLAKY